ncbi:ferredoxin [soil metagenome]|jgi:ferredoxin
MKITVDYDSCASTGVCAQVCPSAFEVRTDGYLYVLIADDVPEALKATVTEAAQSCPTEAITLDG